MSFNVAIDGPSGAGKSTISKTVAKTLGFVYVDTGALYRTIGLYAYQNNINADDVQKVEDSLSDINIEIKFVDGEQRVFLNGADVSEDIRKHIISDYASKISAIPCVRAFLLDMQRKIASVSDCIMDGRDIGSVVLPDADLKIYLTASAEDRANRRYKELIQKGEKVTFEKVLNDVIERDERDMNREISPLKVADGAVTVDTTGNTFEQSVNEIKNIIEEKRI